MTKVSAEPTKGGAIYLDNHASTPVDPRVASVIFETMLTNFGNARSVDHVFGEQAARAIEKAAGEVADLFGSSPGDVHFTSGSTEGARLAFENAKRLSPGGRLRVAASTAEHRSVIAMLRQAEGDGSAVVSWLPVDRLARLDLERIEDTCSAGTDLLVTAAANNEVGTLYQIEEITALAHAHGARVLVDGTQAAGARPPKAGRVGGRLHGRERPQDVRAQRDRRGHRAR